MRLHILSDLHLEFAPADEAPVIADVLILAGDILTADARAHARALTVAGGYLRRCLPVLYVPGNHDFYETVLPARLLALHRWCRQAGISLLHNRVLEWGGVRFWGATMWTDYRLDGPIRQQLVMQDARRWMTDHMVIARGLTARGQRERFDPVHALDLHERSFRRLQRTLAVPFGGPTVVITHHAPHPGSVHTRFAGHPVNGAFVSNLESLIRTGAPALWVHGHVHNSFDYQVHRTRIVANPRGYPRRRQHATEPLAFENPAFDPEKVVEV